MKLKFVCEVYIAMSQAVVTWKNKQINVLQKCVRPTCNQSRLKHVGQFYFPFTNSYFEAVRVPPKNLDTFKTRHKTCVEYF